MIPAPDLIQSLLLLKTRIIKTPPSNMPEKAIVFDVDGTLIDSVDLHTRAWQEALKEVGSHIQFAELRSQIGKGADMFLPSFLTQEKIERCGKRFQSVRKRFSTPVFSHRRRRLLRLLSYLVVGLLYWPLLENAGRSTITRNCLRSKNSSTWRSVRKRCNNRN